VTDWSVGGTQPFGERLKGLALTPITESARREVPTDREAIFGEKSSERSRGIKDACNHFPRAAKGSLGGHRFLILLEHTSVFPDCEELCAGVARVAAQARNRQKR